MMVTDAHDSKQHVTVIEPENRWSVLDWRELLEFRDLYWFLVWRGVKSRYAQSVMGVGWAVIQPVFSMIVFTIVFGRLASVQSDGVPYSVFAFAALIPWTYFANAITDGSNSLISNSALLSKVYFPRIFLPLAAVTAKLIDFAIAMVLLVLMLIWFGIMPDARVFILPYLIFLMMITAAGIGAWLTALAVQYRDVQHATSFLVQLLMYAAPVVYPTSLIPKSYLVLGFDLDMQHLYALNPMVGVIEGFRSGLLGSRPMPWDLIGIGTISALVIAFTGFVYFRKREMHFADVA
jgi:lipopolysaccharide transport system permease protein